MNLVMFLFIYKTHRGCIGGLKFQYWSAKNTLESALLHVEAGVPKNIIFLYKTYANKRESFFLVKHATIGKYVCFYFTNKYLSFR